MTTLTMATLTMATLTMATLIMATFVIATVTMAVLTMATLIMYGSTYYEGTPSDESVAQRAAVHAHTHGFLPGPLDRRAQPDEWTAARRHQHL